MTFRFVLYLVGKHTCATKVILNDVYSWFFFLPLDWRASDIFATWGRKEKIQNPPFPKFSHPFLVNKTSCCSSYFPLAEKGASATVINFLKRIYEWEWGKACVVAVLLNWIGGKGRRRKPVFSCVQWGKRGCAVDLSRVIRAQKKSFFKFERVWILHGGGEVA